MKSKLSADTLSLVREKASKLAADEQISVDHDGCPAGEDTRGRLYIKVTENGKMALAHCFNCGASGGIRLGRVAVTANKERWEGEHEAKQRCCDIDRNLWNNAAPVMEYPDPESWPEKYFMDCWHEFCAADGFHIRRHDGPNRWVLFPRGDKDSPTGWEARSAVKEITRNILPEYKDDTRLLIYNKDASRTAIVCEDPISAMKVSLAGFAGVSLCGTNLSTDDAFKLSLLFDKILVWLDNDKPEVVAQAARIKDKLLMYTSDVKMNYTNEDPKRYQLSYIRNVVEGAF